MTTSFGSLLNLNRDARRSFRERGRCSIPRESPAPVHAHFIMRINHITRAKLMTENFFPILHDADCEILCTISPVRVTHPDSVLASARHFHILINRSLRLIRAGGGGTPLALAALRPFG